MRNNNKSSRETSFLLPPRLYAPDSFFLHLAAPCLARDFSIFILKAALCGAVFIESIVTGVIFFNILYSGNLIGLQRCVIYWITRYLCPSYIFRKPSKRFSAKKRYSLLARIFYKKKLLNNPRGSINQATFCL